MRVRVLGPLEVADGEQVTAITGARLRVLLIRLALDPGRAVSAGSLALALWGEDPPGDPGHALQALVSRLRRALPSPEVLRSVPGGYLLDVRPEAVDAIQFEQLAKDGRRLLRAGQPRAAGERLREALDLWRGEPLADAAQALFAGPAITRLAEMRLAAVEDRIAAELAAQCGNAGVVAELEELAAEHPLRERLRLLLIQALHADGRGGEALAVYESFRQLLAAELGADPGRELRRAHLAVLRGEPPLRPAAGSPQGNLPMPLSSFVGREREREQLAALIADGRLVTLTGPGGAGKTRLATTVAAAAGCPGGAWLVDLAAVTDPREVTQSWVTAMGLGAGEIGASASPDSAARLAEAMPAAETLVVLDNCEHLLDAVAPLTAEVLGRCPRLRVLATSREPLGVPGETVYPVPPLTVPGPEIPPEEAAGFAAPRLFADRAAATVPGFTVTAANAGTVAEICRRLDGLPLAIELATAWLRSLPLEELAARLGDRFALLTAGSRTTPPRHQTLRAVVAWSWDLLSGAERTLAEGLSVFPSGITPEAAQAVAGDQAASQPVLGLLAALVGKSLLQLEPGPRPRYRMLETIREFGLERLAGAGRLARARSAHAAWFTGLAETAEPHLRTGRQLPWLDTLTAEHANLTAALRNACEAGDGGTAVRLAAALGTYWTVRGEHGEAAAWLRQALAAPGNAPPRARAAATALWAVNAVLSGAADRAGLAARALRETTPGPAADHPVAALLAPALALAADDEAGRARAARLLAHPDPWTRGMLCLIRAFLAANHADLAGSAADLAAAADAFGEAGERWGLATSLTFLGYTRLTLGRFGDAAAELAEAVRLLGELGQGDHAVMQRSWLAEALWRQGEHGRARAELLAVAGPGGGGTGRHAFLARKTLADMARLDGDLAESGRLYRAAADDLSQIPAGALWVAGYDALLRSAMAHLAVAGRDLPGAREHISRALAEAVPEDDMPLVATVAVAHARLRHAESASGDAARLLGAAHALRGASDEFNPDVASLAADLRRELGEAGFAESYDAGRRLARAAALALAGAPGNGQARRR
jgi:predicted ATPase/DNA-binding SARP family transcriptional activator